MAVIRYYLVIFTSIMATRFKGIYWALLISVICIAATSCRKDKILTTGGELKFSVDTLTFDTVFTSRGSFTTSFKIYNPQSKDIIISSISLENGGNSYFHLNVDGFQGNSVQNIRIAAKDSVYVFATVNIDPNNDKTPFVVTDRLVTTLNGKTSYIPFEAYGQNAHYIIDSVLTGNIQWQNDLPYVIIHNAAIDEGATLTIEKGCRIYVNQDSRLFVLGKLIVNGTKQDSVIFQGNRLDRKYFGYEGYPGEWGGIYFDSRSSGNIMKYAVLKNCGGATTLGQGSFLPAAIQVNPDSTPNLNDPQLILDHTIIENSIGYGLISFGGTIIMLNSLIHTCGAQALALVQGGGYYIANSSFINYGSNKVSHADNPTVIVSNFYAISQTEYVLGHLAAQFDNCIIWGSLNRELACAKRDEAQADITFNHSLIKVDSLEKLAFVNLQNCKINEDPQFANAGTFDFHIGQSSPAANAGGSTLIPITDDLDGRPRGNPPAIGCYEPQ